MRISTFHVNNYKSFAASGDVTLGTECTVVIGRNNVGKTALIEAIGLTMSEQPHRSASTIPQLGGRPAPGSSAAITVALSRDELLDALDESPRERHFAVPIRRADDLQASAIATAREFDAAIQHDTTVKVTWRGRAGSQQQAIAEISEYPTLGYDATYINLTVDRQRKRIVRADEGIFSGSDSERIYTRVLARAVVDRIYTIKAERPSVGRSPFAPTPILLPDASNLPAVLGVLHGDPGRLARLNRALRRVLPEIHQIAVRPSQSQPGNQEVIVYPFDPAELERPDLAIPLAECGTGVAQVLAILYVAFYSAQPRVLIVDEPQSFLHPGATRSLLEVLRSHAPQHQYIITTHSPTAVTAARPDTILLIQQTDGASRVRTVDGGAAAELNLLLGEVGARFSDVFGADRILWVEGRTEEVCLQRIVEHDPTLAGLAPKILAVRATGDFDGRHARTVAEIYERLAKAGGILPTTVGFLLDREGRKETERAELTRRLGVRMLFTRRRMFENYLMDPQAIADTVNSLAGFGDGPRTAVDVRDWIETHRWSQDFFNAHDYPAVRTPETWITEVNGKAVLTALFADWSEKRVRYDPIRHGLALTEHIVVTGSTAFRELTLLIADAFQLTG